MILVTSAAGNTGRVYVKALVDAGFEVVATDINPAVSELQGIKKSFVGDLTNLAFIKQVVAEVDQIVYIPPLFSAQEVLIGKQMIDSAIDHHVKQFLFVSVTHPILTTLLQHVAKREVEEYLIYKGMETSLAYTILQPMHYMHNFKPEVVAESGNYSIFYAVDSKVAYVDPEDVGEVIVKIASSIEKHNKATYELVGTIPYSPNQLVKQFNQLFDQSAKAIYIPVDTFLDQINAQDLYFRKGFEQLAYSYSTWGLDGNTNVLEFLLGRKPTSFIDYLKKHPID